MRVTIVLFLVHVISLGLTFNLDIFKWPTFKKHVSNIPNPIERINRLRSKTTRKIERQIDGFKSRVDDFKTTVFDKKGIVGYPLNPPSHYGAPKSNGYIKVIRQNPRFQGTQAKDQKQTESNNFSFQKEDFGIRVVDQINRPSNIGQSFKKSHFTKLQPIPVTSYLATDKPKLLTEEINAPVSAAMTIGNLLKNEIIDYDIDKGKWQPYPAKLEKKIKIITPIKRGGKKLGLSLKPRKENEYPPHKSEQEKLLEQNRAKIEDEETKELIKGGKALSHIVDFTIDSFPNDNSIEDNHSKVTSDVSSKVENISSIVHESTLPPSTFISHDHHQEEIASIEMIDSNILSLNQNEKGSRNLMFGSLLEQKKLSIFLNLIRIANLDPMLTTEGGFTIFAPTDSAFKMLRRTVMEELESSTEKLREVILFHVSPGELPLQDIRNEMVLASAAPGARTLRLNIYDFGQDLQPVITVNGARFRDANIFGSNVVVHIIDKVLYPMTEHAITEYLSSCNMFSGANMAMIGSYLEPILNQEGPFTFFIPSTDGFARIDNAMVAEFVSNVSLLQDVLSYHIVPGTYYSEGLRDGSWLSTLLPKTEVQVRVTSDGISKRLSGVGRNARVLRADIPATNGVIHVLDEVMQPGMEMPICGHF